MSDLIEFFDAIVKKFDELSEDRNLLWGRQSRVMEQFILNYQFKDKHRCIKPNHWFIIGLKKWLAEKIPKTLFVSVDGAQFYTKFAKWVYILNVRYIFEEATLDKQSWWEGIDDCWDGVLKDWKNKSEFLYTDEPRIRWGIPGVVRKLRLEKSSDEPLPPLNPTEIMWGEMEPELEDVSEIEHECPICLGELRCQIVCDNGHALCPVCYKAWHKNSSRCPTCRVSMYEILDELKKFRRH